MLGCWLDICINWIMVKRVCDAFNHDVTCFCFTWFGRWSAAVHQGGWMGAWAGGTDFSQWSLCSIWLILEVVHQNPLCYEGESYTFQFIRCSWGQSWVGLIFLKWCDTSGDAAEKTLLSSPKTLTSNTEMWIWPQWSCFRAGCRFLNLFTSLSIETHVLASKYRLMWPALLRLVRFPRSGNAYCPGPTCVMIPCPTSAHYGVPVYSNNIRAVGATNNMSQKCQPFESC